MSSGLHVKWDLTPHPWELKPWRRLWPGDVVWQGCVLVFWRMTCHSGTEASLTDKDRPARVEGLGIGVSKLGCQYKPCAASHGWLCVYAEEQGKEMVPANSFIPREASLWMQSRKDELQEEQIISHYVPQMFFRLLLPHCLPPSYLTASSPGAAQCPSGSIPSKLLTFKPQALSSTGCKNSWNSAPVIF